MYNKTYQHVYCSMCFNITIKVHVVTVSWLKPTSRTYTTAASMYTCISMCLTAYPRVEVRLDGRLTDISFRLQISLFQH